MNRQTFVSVKGPCWQDMDRRVPATVIGQPVAVAENIGRVNGQKIDATQPVAARRPVISAVDENGYTLLFEDATEWSKKSYILPHPLIVKDTP